MSLQGQIDSSFQTEQRDLFASGTVAEIGVNAYAVWSAIKYHADFNTGEAWPGMRKLGELVGLSKSAVDRAVDTLERAHMLRVVKGPTKRKGQTYIARERMAVRIGDRILCTIVMDYIPAQLRGKIRNLEKALASERPIQEVFADVEILPGEGFVWDSAANALRGRVAASDIPALPNPSTEHFKSIGDALLRRIGPGKK